MKEIIGGLLFCHLVSAFALYFREMRETQLGSFGKIMKGVEVCFCGYYLLNIVKCLQVLSFFLYFNYMFKIFPDNHEYF